jgi:hypothetical protein
MQQSQGWHSEAWGTWGIAETVLKLIGVGAGVLAFINSDGNAALRIGDNPHLLALILLVLLTLGAVFQLVVRFGQKETISFGFAVLNLIGHVALVIALLRVPEQATLAVIFGGMYVLGQVVKLQFLRETGYTEGGATTSAMLRVTGAIAIMYVLFVVLMLV